MRFLLATLLTAAFSLIAGIYFPWWSIAVVSFFVAVLIKQKIAFAFLAAFTGVFVLWAAMAFLIDFKNEHILSQKIAHIFPLGGSYILLILLTAMVGALVSGFAAMSGSAFCSLLRK